MQIAKTIYFKKIPLFEVFFKKIVRSAVENIVQPFLELVICVAFELSVFFEPASNLCYRLKWWRQKISYIKNGFYPGYPRPKD